MAKESVPEKTIVNPDEVSLEDIDKILDDNDPGFATALNEVREASETTDVEIESIAIDEKAIDTGHVETVHTGLFSKIPFLKKFGSFSTLMSSLKIRMRNALIIFGRESLAWAKVRPKEYAVNLFSGLKYVFKILGAGFKKFGHLSGTQKIAFFLFIVLGAAAVALIGYNLKGRWVPAIDRPLIKDYNEVSDKTWDLKEEKWVPLFQALRQPEHRYLFDKVVVNLRRVDSIEERNPMGLFEFYVELDSKETAIEVNDRKKELIDLVQRTIEGETYNSLVGESGKQRLKNLIRQDLNQVLNQGWVKEVYISNLVLKP